MRRGGTASARRVYSDFRGADFRSDPSLTDRRRSPDCVNLTAEGGLLKKRPGWRTEFTLPECIHGLYGARFAGGEQLLCHAGDGLYRLETGRPPALLCSGLPRRKSRAVFLSARLWIATGDGLWCWNGSECRPARESAYAPLTTISRAPAGGGVLHEAVNLLTPWRRNSFLANGTARSFRLDGNIDAAGTVRAWVNGRETTEFEVNRPAGTVNFVTAPPAPAAGAEDNVEVLFPHTVPGNAAAVENCRVIAVWGAGNNDRLFLAGNPAAPHIDRWSAAGDPTYFPDVNYAVVGTESSAILGYCRLGDKQAILKEDTGGDTALFLRSAEPDSTGRTVFTVRQAASGSGALAEGSFCPLGDDALFLGREGICAVVSDSLTSRTTVRERSGFLSARLRQERELREAEAAVWNGMYLLAAGQGHVYLLDARQSPVYGTAAAYTAGDFGYEGYYWQEVPARVWQVSRTEAEEILRFGTADGRVCRFRTDEAGPRRYADEDRPVAAHWTTPWEDDGAPLRRKALCPRGCGAALLPSARMGGVLEFRSEHTGGPFLPLGGPLPGAQRQDFAWTDFAGLSFSGDDSPRELMASRRVPPCRRLQLRVSSRGLCEELGICSITKEYVLP